MSNSRITLYLQIVDRIDKNLNFFLIFANAKFAQVLKFSIFDIPIFFPCKYKKNLHIISNSRRHKCFEIIKMLLTLSINPSLSNLIHPGKKLLPKVTKEVAYPNMNSFAVILTMGRFPAVPKRVFTPNL